MTPPGSLKNNRSRNLVNITLAIVAGGAGCLTLVIVLAAVLGGLWLDSTFHTRPTITIVLLLISIPVSVIAMILFARAAVSRIRARADQENTSNQEDAHIGTDS